MLNNHVMYDNLIYICIRYRQCIK